MRSVVLISVSLLLLGLPALSAACTSCVLGPCAEASQGTTPGETTHGKSLAQEPAASELPPCHAAMKVEAEPATDDESAPCHGEDAERIALDCCATSPSAERRVPHFLPRVQPTAPEALALDGTGSTQGLLPEAQKVLQKVSMKVPRFRAGESPARLRVSATLQALHSVWLL